MDLSNVIPSGGAWGVVGVLLMLIVGPYAIFSRDGSDRFWLLAKLSGWVKNRKLREIKESSTLADMTLQAHSDDRARWALQMQELREEMAEDRDRWREELRAIESRADAYWSYILFTAEFARDLSMMAAKYGWEPPPPELLPFGEWKSRQVK